MAIHHSNELPLMEENGYNLRANTQTTLAVREEKIERLKSPYTSACADTWELTSYTHLVPTDKDDPDEFLGGWEYSLPVIFFLKSYS